jgi:hypothetical protein
VGKAPVVPVVDPASHFQPPTSQRDLILVATQCGAIRGLSAKEPGQAHSSRQTKAFPRRARRAQRKGSWEPQVHIREHKRPGSATDSHVRRWFESGSWWSFVALRGQGSCFTHAAADAHGCNRWIPIAPANERTQASSRSTCRTPAAACPPV